MEKRLLIIIGAIGGLVVIALVGFIMWFANTKESKVNEKINYMEDLGKSFYTEFYKEIETNDNEIEDVRKHMEGFAESGLQVNLDSLSRLDPAKKPRIDVLFKDCDYGLTLITVYPTTPFGPEDFTLAVELDC